jgi:UDP-N-acetyl-D-mannosaminuronate dehydrogenase
MKIAVIGQGYVGFPLAQLAARSGFEVIGYDTNSNVINSLGNSEANLKLTDDEGLLKDIKENIQKNFPEKIQGMDQLRTFLEENIKICNYLFNKFKSIVSK